MTTWKDSALRRWLRGNQRAVTVSKLSPTHKASGLPLGSSFYGDKAPFPALSSKEEPVPAGKKALSQPQGTPGNPRPLLFLPVRYSSSLTSTQTERPPAFSTWARSSAVTEPHKQGKTTRKETVTRCLRLFEHMEEIRGEKALVKSGTFLGRPSKENNISTVPTHETAALESSQ